MTFYPLLIAMGITVLVSWLAPVMVSAVDGLFNCIYRNKHEYGHSLKSHGMEYDPIANKVNNVIFYTHVCKKCNKPYNVEREVTR